MEKFTAEELKGAVKLLGLQVIDECKCPQFNAYQLNSHVKVEIEVIYHAGVYDCKTTEVFELIYPTDTPRMIDEKLTALVNSADDIEFTQDKIEEQQPNTL